MRETDLRAVSVTKTLMMLLVVLGHACIVFAASAWGLTWLLKRTAIGRAALGEAK